MSYKAKVFYVLESDPTYTLKYDSLVKDVNIGDLLSLSFLDFDYKGTHYYVKYAINNGSVYKRGINTIDCKSMMISDDYRYMSWYVFCTEDETDITGDCAVSCTDIAKELYLSISTGNSDSVSTRGKETLISVSISQGCVSDSFASYGSTYSPTMSCEMYAENNDFTDALIAKTYYNNTLKGTIVNAWIIIGNEFAYPVPIGRFVVKENPTYNGETVSFTGNGFMSEYMDNAEIEISALNKYHEEELENKYVKTGNMDFISYDSDSYFWEFLPEDFLRVTGSPLHIDNWNDILIAIETYGLQQLMIPVIANSTYNDDTHEHDTEFNSRITWRELLSGIAVLLRGNVIEKNGAFYIKRLPEVQQDGFRPIFDASMYDSSAIFGNNLMSPSNISVKANNWLPYTSKDQKYTYPIGFGYCDGESTVVLNDSVSSIQNVENYPVTIECPWILFETLNRNTNQGHDWYPFIGNDRAMNWQTGLRMLNRAFVYHKASFETMAWHPLMNVGDIIIVEDHDGVKRYVFVGEMTLHYNGTVYAEITSPCEVQETNTSSAGGGGSTSYNSGTTAQASGTAMGTMLGAIFKDGVITNSKIADSTITNAKISDATIEWEKVSKSFITDLTADNAYIKNLKATIGEFGYITAENADLTYATITSLQAVDGKIDTLTSKAITTDNLEAKVATLGYLSAESADVKFATIESLTAVDGKIDTLSSKAITTENLSAKVAELGYLSTESAEIGYAKIDFSNVGTQVVSSSMIIDGAVTNEKVGNLSANKITSGAIDASKVTVSNLNASNINTGTLTVGGVTLNIKENKAEIDGSDIKDGTVTLEGLSTEVKDAIDGAIETFTKSEIPTLNNEPASLWNDNETRKKHIGDVCYVLNPTSSANGYCYRFSNTGTEASPSYEWVLIKDSDVTKALQDIININKEITGIKKFDTDISSWKNDTDEELSSLKLRTTTLETDMGSKVESSVFNEVKQTVDENSSSIASLSTTVSKKADGSTVETLTNTVNEVKQTADSNSLSISGMQTEIGKKADGSTVTELSAKTSKLEQNLDGFKTEVSKTYTTKTEFDNLEIGGRNLIIGSSTATVNSNWSQNGWGGSFTTYDSYSRTYKLVADSGWNVAKYKLDSSYAGKTLTLSLKAEKVKSETTATENSSLWYTNDTGGNPFITGYFETKSTEETETGTLYSLFCTVVLNSDAQIGIGTFCAPQGNGLRSVWLIKDIKLELGNKATDWTQAPEDTEESIKDVKTIAEQTADKFSWLVKSGTSATNFELTDRTATLVSNYINLNGLVTFSGLNSDAQNKINNAENAANTANSNASSAISTANNANSNASTALNTVNNIEIGGSNLLLNTQSFDAPYTVSDPISSGTLTNAFSKTTESYRNLTVRGGVTITTADTICKYIFRDFNLGDTFTFSFYAKGNLTSLSAFFYGETGYVRVAKSVTSQGLTSENRSDGFSTFIITSDWQRYWVTWTLTDGGDVTIPKYVLLRTDGSDVGQTIYVCGCKLEKGNKATDWTPAPEDISVENIYTPNTTTIDGGKITTESIKAAQLDVEKIFADEAVLKELFSQNITATGTITGATLKGAHVESTSGSIGGFDIGEDSLSLSGTDGDSTFYTGLTNKALNGDAFGSLTSYWKMSGAGTVYGDYVQISHGGIEAGTISGTTPTYTPSFRVSGDSITIGDIASLEIKNNELIGIFDGTTPTIVTRTLTLNAMSLAGNYDGETAGTIESISGYVVLAVIPRTSGATDVCWVNCYFDSSNVVHARLKNTASSAKNNFKPTVEVMYRLI